MMRQEDELKPGFFSCPKQRKADELPINYRPLIYQSICGKKNFSVIEQKVLAKEDHYGCKILGHV
jgi:hypothetical protein